VRLSSTTTRPVIKSPDRSISHRAPGTFKFARLLWFNRELTITEQRTIEAYLRNKYTTF